VVLFNKLLKREVNAKIIVDKEAKVYAF